MAKKKANIHTKGLRGISNIHFAPLSTEGEYSAPEPITLAKKIENKLKYEGSQEWADNMIVDSSFLYAGGEGKLEVIGLSIIEQILLFGNNAAKGGVYVTDSDEAPEGAYIFEMQKKNGHRRLYVVYNCKNSPTDIKSETIEDGKAEWQTNEIEFQIGSLNKDGVNYIYFFVDTDAEDAVQEQITNWYKTVQFPQNPSPLGFNEVKAKKSA
ncbi:MAG: hypothetical protein KIB00_16310 [Paeniclostridium sordellii]|nr:hypothetical protein [Paeniclostridium sordellii]